MKNNVLIVGAGKIGTIRATVIKKLSPKSKLYIFDTNFKKATLLAKEVNGIVVRSLTHGLKDKNIDAVIVAVVNQYSKIICLLALKNKKHVLCEKPMGVNYKEAKQIELAVKKYKKRELSDLMDYYFKSRKIDQFAPSIAVMMSRDTRDAWKSKR